MNQPSLLNFDLLKPYLRVVVRAAWLGWIALAVIALFIPAEPERRAQLAVVLFVGAAYIFLVSRFLIIRFINASWFPYGLGASSILMLFVIARAFPLFASTLDAGQTVVLLIVLLVGNRRAAIVTGLLGSISIALLEWGQVETTEWLYGFADRIFIDVVLTVLVSEALNWSLRTWRDSIELAERSSTQAERQSRELRALHDLATAVGSSLDLNHVLDLAMSKTLAVMHMDGALIALINEETQTLELTAQADLPQELADRIALKPLAVGEGLSGQVAKEGHPLFSEEVGSDPRAANPYIAEYGYKAYFCFALKAGSQIFGVMNIVSFERRAPDANELAFLEALGEQVGLAVQRAQSYAALQKQRALAESLVRVAQLVGEGHDLSTPLDGILAELKAVVPYESAAIMLVEDRVLRVSAARGQPADATPLDTRFPVDGDTVISDLLRAGMPIVLQDTTANPRWQRLAGYEYIRSWAGTPLLRHGSAIGVLTVDRDKTGAFHSDEIQLLSTFAGQAAAAIDKAQLFRQAERRSQQLSALNQIGQAIGAELELSHVLQLVYEQIGALTGNRDFYIALYDERTDEVSFPLYYEKGERVQLEPRRHGQGMTETVIRSRKPLMLNNDIDQFNRANDIALIGMPSRSWMGVPLLKGEKVIGVMTVQNYEQSYAYDEEDLELFRTLAGQVAVAVENARLYENTQRDLRDATVLFEFSRTVSQLSDPEQIALAAAHACGESLPGSTCTIYAYEDDSPLLLPLAFVSGAEEFCGELAVRRLESLTDEPLPPPIVLAAVEYPRMPLRSQANGPLEIAASRDTRICRPIMIQERVLGAILVEGVAPNITTESAERFLQSLCSQLGVALEGARLKRIEERRTRELSSLYEVSQAFGAMGDPYATFDEITRRLAQIFHAQGAIALLYDAKQNMMQAQAPAFGAPDEWVRQVRFTLDERFLELWNPNQEASLIVNDPRLLSKGIQSTLQRYQMHHLLGAAMFGRQGLMGLLFVTNHADRRQFNHADSQLLTVLAHQAALAIENAQLVETERASRQQLAVVNQVGQKVSATLEVNELLTELTSFIREHLHYHALAFYFVEGDEVVTQSVVGGLQGDRGFRQHISVGLLGWVVRNRAPRLANDTLRDPEFIDPSGSGLRSELAVPLLARGEVIGVISAASDKPNRFTESDVVLLSTIADQVAQGIYDARLYQSERQGRQRLQLVNRIARRILSITTLQGLVQEIATAVEETFKYEVVQTMLLEGDELVKRGSAGTLAKHQTREYRQSIQEGIFGFAARTSNTYVANDVSQDPLYIDAMQMGIQSEAAIPFRAAGKVIGLLVAASERLSAFSASDITTLETVADQAAQAIVNVRLYEAEQRRANQLATISHFGREIASLLNRDELLERAVRLIHERFHYFAVHIFMVNETQGTAVLAAGVHEGKPSELGVVTLAIGKEGLIGRAIGENKAIRENDVLRNPSYYAVAQFNFIRSELVVPIRHGERVLGALDAQDDHRDAFGEEDLFVLQTLADQLAVAIVNSELHMAVERQAHADSLTGVYNHGYFLQCLNDELVHAQRTGQPLALIMLDIDYFKQYNDRYGHVIGDRVLQVIVQAIRQNIKHEDLVGRWGGEEFAIALPNTSASQGLIVAERIRRTLAAMEMRDNAGGPIEKPTISQGLAAFPDHANSAEALVDRTDRMLYLAKEHGRDQVVQYQMHTMG